MTNVIGHSFEKSEIIFSTTILGHVRVKILHGLFKSEKLTENNFQSITKIDEDVYRSAGNAAAGAIIGGLLTGGIGLIAGAAIGGRRKKEASYLIMTHNGNHIAFTTKDKILINRLEYLTQVEKTKEMVKKEHEQDK